MAEMGAINGVANQRSYHCPDASDMLASMKDLVDQGLARSLAVDRCQYQLTEKGMTKLQLVQSIKNHYDVFHHVRKEIREMSSSVTGLNRFRARTRLGEEEWRDIQTTSVKDAHPYTKDSAKRYFYKPGLVTKPYLLALCVADEMLSLGLLQLHHFQSNGYYNTLLEVYEENVQSSNVAQLLNRVQPNQPRVYYKELQTRSEKANVKTTIELDPGL